MYNSDAEKYLIHILKCVLNNEKPDEKPNNVDFEEVARIAATHKVDTMAFYGIEKLKNRPSEELYKQWEYQKNYSMYKDTLQTIEYDAIVNKFLDAGIAIIPLKGFGLKKLYPSPEYRWMNDIDILVKEKDFDRAGEKIEELGYKAALVLEKDIEYINSSGIQVEIHKALLEQDKGNYEYFKNIWDKAICEDENKLVYRMSAEDEYIYLIEHANKHFGGAGTGIRTVLDIYLYEKKYKDTWNADYINAELKKIGLGDFNKKILQLGRMWFEEDYAVSDEFEKYIMESGVFGTSENNFIHKIGRNGIDSSSTIQQKVTYTLKQAFPPYEEMCKDYKLLEKAPVLLPLCYVHKVLRILFVRRQKIKWLFKAMKSDNNKPDMQEDINVEKN